MAVYVDDVLLTGNDNIVIKQIKHHLDAVFTITYLGKLRFFLEIEVDYTSQGMILTQQKYTKDLLKTSAVTKFKHVVTPLPVNLKLNNSDGEKL